jgi:hypothetical protein
VKQQPEWTPRPCDQDGPPGATFADGVLLGLLIASGHLGGDARQPQVTLRMHVRHRDLFRFLLQRVPGSRLYGPYAHGGREYYQWMVRGPALREHLEPLLERTPLREIDPPTHGRLVKMQSRYRPATPAR